MGPLSGIKVIELAGIGPGPMCAMLLADLGATVLRIDRRQESDLGLKRPLKFNLLLRNRKSIALDLKQADAVEFLLRLVESSDALIEPFRPGVAERLGIGPAACHERNPRLVYGRMTGWGQSGPLSKRAGHDLNYIAITGVLNAIGRKNQAPSVPLNLIGDYAGGSMYLAMGILAGIIEAGRSGIGQVVDAAIVDGAASLATSVFGMLAAGMFGEPRGCNATDSGSHFYDVYQCADGAWISVAPIESKFYLQLLERLGIDPAILGDQMDPACWTGAKQVLAEKFKTKTRDQWTELLAETDACVAPVLDWREAADHPQIRARQTLIDVEGVTQPAPAPRFSRSTLDQPYPPAPISPANTELALSAWCDREEIEVLRHTGVID